MAFSRDQVKKIAELARLSLSDAEMDKMAVDLGAILDYVEQLKAVDGAGVEPLAHCLPIHSVFREDEPTPSLDVDAALANAPKRTDDFYAVPAILD